MALLTYKMQSKLDSLWMQTIGMPDEFRQFFRLTASHLRSLQSPYTRKEVQAHINQLEKLTHLAIVDELKKHNLKEQGK